MATVFNIKSGEFVDDSGIKPVEVLSGAGAPDDLIGADGDFYIDSKALEVYGPKAGAWGEPAPMVGAPGESVAIEEITPLLREMVAAIDLPLPLKGDKGDSVTVDQVKPLIVESVNKAVSNLTIPPGRGIASIAEKDGKAVITYTDGGKDSIYLPVGKPAREVELGRNQTHIQWRYAGGKWIDLMPIPARSRRGGGAHHLRDLSDIDLTGLADGDTLVWNAAQGKFIPGSSGTGESYLNHATSTILTAADTHSVITNSSAAALVVETLPAAATGLKFTFIVTDDDGFQLQAVGADVIRITGSASTPGGTQICTELGGSVTLYGHSGGWTATSSLGTWFEA